MNYLVVTIKSWNIANFQKLQAEDTANQWFLITDKNELTLEKVRAINPRYIFFPHWSWIIPGDLYNNFECVVFHMTDLPYGRGGSPLQNLIVRGHTTTKICALQVVEKIDAGPVYLKHELDLSGTAREIFDRASKTIGSMIEEIVINQPIATPQEGEPTFFSRRK